MAVVAAAPQPPPAPGPGPGAGTVPVPVILVLAVFFAALSVALLYTIIQFWPAPAVATGAQPSSDINYFGFSFSLPEEARIFVIIVTAGAVGGAIHSLRSLSWYVGVRSLVWSWILMYCLLPIVGALLATIFYVVLRGGLLAVQTSSSSLNVYGFAAVGALVGLFSEQAAAKLKDVFSEMFTTAEKGSEHVAPGH
jgi:hypothetical protein